MQALDLLNSKIDMLLKKYAALEAENKRLKTTIAAQDKTVELLTKKLASLDQGMVSVHLGQVVTDEDEKEHMRRQLDNVIAEIDKILTTLND
jgi:predicted RNase H-like nuclease (RuvC/YqgF family)